MDFSRFVRAVFRASFVLAVSLPSGARAAASHYWPRHASLERANQIVENTGAILWEMSDTYFHQGDYKQVKRLGHAVARLSPHLEDVYPSVSWLEWSDGDSASAEADLLEGVRQNQTDYYVYSELADCYQIWLKKPAASIPYYLRATDYPDTPWMVFGALAHAAEKAGDYSRAAIAWRMAIIRADGDPVKVVPSQHNLDRVLGEIAAQRAGHANPEAGSQTRREDPAAPDKTGGVPLPVRRRGLPSRGPAQVSSRA